MYMKTYSKNDLLNIIIRAKDSNGKWASLNLLEVDDLQFKQWLREKLVEVGYTPNTIDIIEGEYILTPILRTMAINQASELGLKFVTLKRVNNN
jgi:hypothetical protein